MPPDSSTPIVVRLTPPGRGAVVTLRVEGPRAVEIVQSLFRSRDGKPLADHPEDRLLVGRFKAEEVVVRRTGDAVELHCHGGTAAVEMIEETLAEAGCRPTAWRDWANGRKDNPIKAAARTALADARTERTASILLDQFDGALERAIDEICRTLDSGDAASARRIADSLLARAELGMHLVRPWNVVLAGRSNVGKSSTINALAGYRRAIVHHSPGTTRDAVTLTTAIDGWPVELCDTAGLRRDAAPIEKVGIELAEKRLEQADLRILIFDLGSPWSDEDQSLLERWPEALVVHNKCDLPSADGDRPAGLAISALTGVGIPALLDGISERLVPDPPPPGAAVPFTPEQVETVRRLAESSLG